MDPTSTRYIDGPGQRHSAYCPGAHSNTSRHTGLFKLRCTEGGWTEGWKRGKARTPLAKELHGSNIQVLVLVAIYYEV